MGLTYTSTGSGYKVTGYTNTIPTFLEIPENHNNKPIIEIATEAFQNQTTLRNIALPESLRTLGQDAFNGCSALTTVVIPNSTESIGLRCFQDCADLKSIYIQEPSKITFSHKVFDGAEPTLYHRESGLSRSYVGLKATYLRNGSKSTEGVRTFHLVPNVGTIGAALLCSTESGQVSWVTDLFLEYQVSDKFKVETLLVEEDGVTKEITLVAASSASGVLIAKLVTGAFSVNRPVLRSENFISTSVCDHVKNHNYLTHLETTCDARYGLLVLAYYKTPTSEFYIQAYRENTSTEFGAYSVLSGDIKLSNLTVGGSSLSNTEDSITSVHTIPKRFLVEGVTKCYDLPVVITESKIYLVRRAYNTNTKHFTSVTYEAVSEIKNYNSVHFGETTTIDTVGDLAAIMGYREVTPAGIFYVGTPDTEEVSLNFITITVGVEVLTKTSSSRITSYFDSTISKVVVALPKLNILSTQDLDNPEFYLIGQNENSIYLRVGHKVTEFDITASDIDKRDSMVFDRDGYTPVTFSLGANKSILEHRETTTYLHTSLAPPEEVEETVQLGYTTKQLYTETSLDVESLEREHQILLGTRLDKTSNIPLSKTAADGSFTGSYSSSFGFAFISKQGQTRVFSSSVKDGLVTGALLATNGTLVSGADFSTQGVRRTILRYDLDGITILYCIKYLPEPVISQELMVRLPLVGGIAAVQQNSKDLLFLSTASTVYKTNVASFGIMLNGDDTFQESLQSSTGEIADISTYMYRGVDAALSIATDNTLATYTIIDGAAVFKRDLDLGYPVTGITTISDKQGEVLITWSTEDAVLMSYTHDRLGELVEIKRIQLPSGVKLAVSQLTISAATSDSIQVYRKNRTLTEADEVLGEDIAKAAVVALGQHLLVTQGGSLEVYKWWTGVSPEVYYDHSLPTFHVPLHSVAFEENPPYYDREVIERDLMYQEPITVAYESTSSTRSRQVVSNRRLAFREEYTLKGDKVLAMSDNTTKLLRNSVMWCLGLEADTLVADDLIVPDENPYEQSEFITSSTHDLFAMTANPVCGNLEAVEDLLEHIPGSGILVEAKYLPYHVTEDILFENKEVHVHSRTVEGSEQLRVEFGEYKGYSAGQTYQTPGYIGVDEGLLSTEGNIAQFWEGLWAQSAETNCYLSTLLDLRTTAKGVAKATDLTPQVNPAKLLLTHFFSNAVITVIKVKAPSSSMVDQALLDLLGVTSLAEAEVLIDVGDKTKAVLLAELTTQLTTEYVDNAKQDMARVPWLQINKTLPVSSKCVTVYVIIPNLEEA